MVKILLIIILFVTHYSLIAQTRYHSTEDILQAVEQNEVIDIVFTTNTSIQKPFLVNFEAIFVGPNGEMTVPGFYNGDKEWILRFSTSRAGEWHYTTCSDLKTLDRKNGKILVVSGNGERHGAITRCSKDQKKFCYEDGTPYFLQAFESDWLFALDYDNPDGAPKTDHLLKLLSDNGFNQIVTTVYSYDIRPETPYWTRDALLQQNPEHDFGGRDDIYPFLGSNSNPDHTSLNVTFFKRFDRMVSTMDKYNIVAHLMIYVWNKKVNWPAAESAADNMYFDYIIKRYQAFPNVIWDISKEALNNKRCSEEYGLERINRIDSLDAYGRLVTVHDFGFCERNVNSVDFISIQDWSFDIHPEMMAAFKKFEKPIVNIEHGGYEKSPYIVFPGYYDNPEYCLKRNYLCYFSGTYATYYWQGAAWNVIIHNPFEQNKKFIHPKFEYYKHLESFFREINYNRFIPNYTKKGSLGRDYGLVSKDGKVILKYIPKENYQYSIYGKKGIGQISGTYQWFNTRTGQYSSEYKYQGGNLIHPWGNSADAILIRKL